MNILYIFYHSIEISYTLCHYTILNTHNKSAISWMTFQSVLKKTPAKLENFNVTTGISIYVNHRFKCRKLHSNNNGLTYELYEVCGTFYITPLKSSILVSHVHAVLVHICVVWFSWQPVPGPIQSFRGMAPNIVSFRLKISQSQPEPVVDQN